MSNEHTASTEASGSRQERIVMLPLPDGMTRMESGPVQFGDDWPGLFMRGDEAIPLGMYMHSAAEALRMVGDEITAMSLEHAAARLMACRAT